MKFIGKIIAGLGIVTALSCIAFTGCTKDNNTATKRSELYGTFTYQETLGLGDTKLRITHDTTKLNSNREYISSTVYPINGNSEGTNISYNMDQRLKLNRDYTYKYDYTVLLSNPGDWGASFARLLISITGTFDYRETAVDGKYNVVLNDPTEGEQTVYAFTIGSSNIYNWYMHSQPDLVIDYQAAAAESGYVYDRYAGARMITVNKNDKTVSDDIFYSDLLDYIAHYCTY